MQRESELTRRDQAMTESGSTPKPAALGAPAGARMCPEASEHLRRAEAAEAQAAALLLAARASRAAAAASQVAAAALAQAAEADFAACPGSAVFCIRSAGRAKTLRKLLPKCKAAFGDVVFHVFVHEPEMADYQRELAGIDFVQLQQGASGANGQVDAAVAFTAPGQHLVVLDDNVSRWAIAGKTAREGQLGEAVRQAATAMQEANCRVWAARWCSNLWGKPEPTEPTVGRYLVYGCCFGMWRSSADDVLSVKVSICDDVERTARVLARDQQIVLMKHVALHKDKEPGTWQRGSGGQSSAFRNAGAHAKAKLAHMQAIALEFPSIIELRPKSKLMFSIRQ